MSRFLRRGLCLWLVIIVTTTLCFAHTFTDVPAGHWTEDSISRGVELGLFNGTSATTFGLGESMTRGAFVVLLGRLLEWEAVSPATASFSDVSTSSWYYSAIETALHQGAITQQFSTFRPDQPITREEMAVMLVRALGYTTMAGLVQNLSLPFTDVSTNRGYIAMAYELGLMSGTTSSTFAPSAYTTREQTAVILMRLYDKCTTQQQTYAIVHDGTDTTALTSQAIIALPFATLSAGVSARINPQTTTLEQQTAIATIHENGGTALLYLSGTAGAMRGTVSESVDVIMAYIDSIGYDGLFLDVAELSARERTFLTQLVQALDTALGDAPLFVMAEAPTWYGTQYNGYDYATLSHSVTQLVLRVTSYQESQDSFLIAPLEPLEEVYYAFTHLSSTVEWDVLSLLITTTAASRTGSSGYEDLTASDVSALLSQSSTQVRTSDRYGCEYLLAQVTTAARTEEIVAWYLNGDQVLARKQLCDLFGVSSVVLSDGSSLLPDVAAALS